MIQNKSPIIKINFKQKFAKSIKNIKKYENIQKTKKTGDTKIIKKIKIKIKKSKNIKINFKNIDKNPPVEKKHNCRRKNIKWERDNDGYYLCPCCDWKSKNQSTASEHYTQNHSKKQNSFECSYCGQIFPLKSRLHQHVIRYHEVKKLVCCHSGCKKECKTTTELRTHYGRKHISDDGFDYIYMDAEQNKKNCKCKCKKCGKISSRYSIYYHMAVCQGPFTNKCRGNYKTKKTEKIIKNTGII